MTKRSYLFYMPALLGGGAERVFALLASQFAARGHHVIFAVDYEAHENAAFLSPEVEKVLLPKGHLRATLGLMRLIRAQKPDCTLSGLGVANLKHMIAATLAGRARRAIITFHGFFASENTRFLSWLGNTLTPLLTRLAGGAIAVSDGLRANLIEKHGASAAQLVRIYNPVIAAGREADVSAQDLAARAPLVLFVGRFHPDKDIPTLLEAFSRVAHPGARLEIAGDGPERAALEAKADALGLRERIQFVGYLSDPAQAYGRARVLVLASRRETFGNVVAEALAYGVPVVSTATDGPSEILEGGRFGALVPVGDAAAMAHAIDAALDNPGDPAARMRHAAQFAVDTATDNYLAATQAVIARA